MAQNVQQNYPRTAYILSLIAGILMVLSSVVVAFAFSVFFVVAPYHRMMYFAWPAIAFGMMSFFGFISGIIVLVSAFMLKSKPAESTTWGILIIVFSIFSFFGMGGFVIGAILGIIGGAFALSYNHT
ncbi:MAG: DUF6114 domain-containing protein [Nitrososphaeria archaeon]|nr:DUF6114 domain-containing protein [Conexivisphaerales archaeon]